MMMITRELICINLLFATPRKCSQELTSDGSSPGAPGSPRYRLSYSGTALPVVKHLTWKDTRENRAAMRLLLVKRGATCQNGFCTCGGRLDGTVLLYNVFWGQRLDQMRMKKFQPPETMKYSKKNTSMLKKTAASRKQKLCDADSSQECNESHKQIPPAGGRRPRQLPQTQL